MAKDSFNEALRAVLRHEGGYVDHPRDPGGATNLGITQGTLAAWKGRPVTKAEVRALTVDEAGLIYRARYWDPIKGDKLPAGLDLALFDFAVNSGVSRAVRTLQSIVGARVDGDLGLITLQAINGRSASALIRKLQAARLAFLRRLGTWSTFGRGWARRVREVEADALAVAAHSPGVDLAFNSAASEPLSITPTPRGLDEDIRAAATPSGRAGIASLIAALGAAVASAGTAARQIIPDGLSPTVTASITGVVVLLAGYAAWQAWRAPKAVE
jgi:lysozyme family protein